MNIKSFGSEETISLLYCFLNEQLRILGLTPWAIGHQVCSSSKFVSEASYLELLFICVLNLFLLAIQPPFTVSFSVVHLRWLTIEKFQNYETVKGGCLPRKNNFKTQINDELRCLASDINFKLLHTGCSIAHAQTPE